MRRLLPLLAVSLAACTWFSGPAVNPDPNHAHADFAVWFEDQQVDFGRPEFMSEAPAEGAAEGTDDHLHKYFHLHDGNGHVVHSHKPGQPLSEFFASLGMEFTEECFRLDPDHAVCTGAMGTLRMFVNGDEVPVNPAYVFEDLDKILIVFASTEESVENALEKMTDDACLYSRTCPERGDPPTENCIADPTVPCVQ